ncbi:uncharacterized protein TRIVIDRAFT_124493, partial [Trichoderma virens Gv29-8]
MRPLFFSQLLFVGIQASKIDVSQPIRADQANCHLYAIQPSDSCIDISSKNNITYAQLLSWNPSIKPTCSPLGNCVTSCISTDVFDSPIPSPTLDHTTSRCANYYKVVEGDDCPHLTALFAITLTDFLFLNSEVWQNCTNLQIGYYYCVEPVGYISTYPGYGSTPTTRPFNQTSATSLPYSGDPWAKFSSNVSVIPIANNTRVDCYSYVYITNLTDNLFADCWNMASMYDITPEELVLWNPSLSEDGSASGSDLSSADVNGIASAIAVATTASSPPSTPYTYPCTVAANTSYCVALVSPTVGKSSPSTVTPPPGPHAAGEISNCTTWYALDSSDTCQEVLQIAHLTFAEFYGMNPSVGPYCAGLVLGTNYCISTYPNGMKLNDDWDGDDSIPSSSSSTTSMVTGIVTPMPTQSGMVSNCNKFYDVHSGDGCSAIASSQHVDLSSFYKWNPAVKTDCSGLQASVYVCIGVATTSASSTTSTSASKPTTTSKLASTTSKPTTTSKSTGIITPTPTQSGMVKNCNKFYDVRAGDGCAVIASSQQIDLSSFYKWNPAVKTDCSGLQASVYVCIGTVATATTSSITTPTPTQSGMVSGCTKFYDVHAGDGCSAIANSQHISLSSLYKWNPAVKTDCSGLQASVYICIGVATA